MLGNTQYNATYDQNDTVLYDQLIIRDQNQITFNLARRKGSNGNVTVHWAVNIQSGNRDSVRINPMTGEAEFMESQWNSRINIEIVLLLEDRNELTVNVSLVNVTGGASLGNFTSMKITNFPKLSDGELEPSRNPLVNTSVIMAVTLILIALAIAATVFVCYRRRSVIKCSKATIESVHLLI